MLQHNLIFGIQKKIKEGRAQNKSMMPLDESTTVGEEVEKKETQVILEGSLNSGIYQQTHKAKEKLQNQKRLLTESFTTPRVQKKLDKDIVFFNYLFENFVPDNSKTNFEIILESVFTDTIRIYQECDVTPRLISPALNSSELNESQIQDIYRNNLNESIKNNYTKPILSGKINELYESEIKDLTRQLIQEGVDLNPEHVRVYMPFEESVSNFIKEVVIPETAGMRINSFMESTSAEYTDLLEESAEEILNSLHKKVKLLASLVAPNMFDKVVDSDEGGVDAPKMAGITIVTDKNFQEPGEPNICPAAVAASDAEANIEMEIENEAEDLDEEESEIPEENTTGAVELDLPLENGDQNPENGMVTNDHDVSLSGPSIDDGILGDEDAELPAVPESPDDVDDQIEDMMSDEDISEENPSDEDMIKKDVSESKK